MFKRESFKYNQSDSSITVKGYVLANCGYFVSKGYYKVIHIPTGVRICSFGATHLTAKNLFKDAAKEMCQRLAKLQGLEESDIALIPKDILNQIQQIEESIRQEY